MEKHPDPQKAVGAGERRCVPQIFWVSFGPSLLRGHIFSCVSWTLNCQVASDLCWPTSWFQPAGLVHDFPIKPIFKNSASECHGKCFRMTTIINLLGHHPCSQVPGGTPFFSQALEHAGHVGVTLKTWAKLKQGLQRAGQSAGQSWEEAELWGVLLTAGRKQALEPRSRSRCSRRQVTKQSERGTQTANLGSNASGH